MLLVTQLEREEVDNSNNKGGREDEEKRFFFSLFMYVSLIGAISSWRAFNSSTSPFRISFIFSFPFIIGFSPTKIFRV